jgi:two-component system, cell cycle sensor histidine kinase and response regulator CckA
MPGAWRQEDLPMSSSVESAAVPPRARILVVDDEPTLVALVRTMLWRAGYEVLEASCAEAAMQAVSEQGEPIQLLLTDIAMPGMNGYELAEAMTSAHPGLKVLFMSGYTDKTLFESTGRSLGDAPLLRKPFTQYKLTSKVAEVLEQSPVS